VLVSYEGEIKLIDFGLAASRLKVEKTAPNVVMGKMAYMSPEQARGDTIDSRADIFACGVLLYELLVGEPTTKA
jgi:serine/threonine-protein kinase